MFVYDDFARRHLREWFAAGGAPNDWDLGDLESFEAWLIEWVEQDDLPEFASWPELVRQYESELTAQRFAHQSELGS